MLLSWISRYRIWRHFAHLETKYKGISKSLHEQKFTHILEIQDRSISDDPDFFLQVGTGLGFGFQLQNECPGGSLEIKND